MKLMAELRRRSLPALRRPASDKGGQANKANEANLAQFELLRSEMIMRGKL